MKEIIIRVPDDMARLVEQWALYIPDMEVVCQNESVEYGIGDKDRIMSLVLRELKQNGAIRHSYDYTWIMVAINDGVINGMGAFRSPQSYMDYLANIGIENVPSRTTISTWFGKVLGSFPNWQFVDTTDPQEILRRKNVVNQFISMYNKVKKQTSEQKTEQKSQGQNNNRDMQ